MIAVYEETMIGRSLNNRIDAWTKRGLINEAQSKAIREYENNKPTKSWVIYGIAAIGATAFCTGLISIIAANWDVIPGHTKLIAYFLLLSILGLVTYHFNKTPGVIRETLITLFALSLLAGIGLSHKFIIYTANPGTALRSGHSSAFR
jgi:uncharacterized membrane protein